MSPAPAIAAPTVDCSDVKAMVQFYKDDSAVALTPTSQNWTASESTAYSCYFRELDGWD